ncbi:DUF6143 family protein [Papillibacter cinnamivorans]|uniref:Uncharacterized protein n=1 Tax=Papillibacter cinnamivorans DSM 12816 TaxID=1122930 RepID=A0A1W2C9U8_9FIRM|nr:DUF6143 family protein [Papillibacter cinnamivorans]SMC81764.1 hypothetical protein SAMN02745168_2621 [Papillibacter cinnamivorans DSM 12816]
MESCRKNAILLPNPITQVAGMPYSLYLSLQGKYFLGSSGDLTFGNGANAWAGLFNPCNSRVNLHVYSWEVANTGTTPVRVRIYFNSCPPGQGTLVDAVYPGNTALCPPPRPRINLYRASDVSGEPEGGVKVFVRRALPGVTVGDEEVGKFIFPPGGSFLLFLSDPETPDEPASATLGFSWWEEAIN